MNFVTKLLNALKESREDSKEQVCKSCGEVLSYSNTVTPAGWDEYNISGLCEKCFDDTTFCMEDGLDDLN